MKQGWISVHRQLQENWLWSDKPFSKGQAFIDILLMANYKENKFAFGNEVVKVPAGSFITSEIKLMERWGWSKSKVRRFLGLLESDGMIIRNVDRKRTEIFVVNYGVYQNLETEKEPKKDVTETNKQPLKDTNNKAIRKNNFNNEKESNIPMAKDDPLVGLF